jgi:flagellar motility protein MotE (MotC chaperone)
MADNAETKAKRLSELDEEEEAGGKKKKEKKPKGGKGGKGGKDGGAEGGKDGGKDAKEKAPKKRHPVLLTLLLVFGFWLLLAAAVILVCRLTVVDPDTGEARYLLDPEGVIRGPILLFLNPDEEPREVYYESELSAIYEKEQELDDLIAEQQAKIDELDDRESALDDRESDLDDRESVIDEWLLTMNEYNAQGSAGYNDINDVAKSVEAMQPAAAANVIVNMDSEKALAVLRAMKAKPRGLLLAAMTPEDAAVFVEQLVPEPPDTSGLDPLPSNP